MPKLLEHSSQCLFRITLDAVEQDKMTYSVENYVTGHIFDVKSVPEYVDVEHMSHSIRISAETILLSAQPLTLIEGLLINEAGYRLFMGREEGYLYSSDESAPVLHAIDINLCENTGGIVLTDINKNILVDYGSAKKSGHDED